ncbi:MAG: hypothetical protein IIW91_01240 [Alistipes sp.]|nr:hypothetical protein [Alistipes sp.]
MNGIEATVALCKCGETKKIYGVRFQRMESGNWKYTWAFPMRSTTAKREGYDNTIIEGMIEPEMEYPGCPYCGTKYFVICSCGKLNCNIGHNNRFTCGWCHTSGTLTAYGGGGIQSGGDR